MANYTEQELRAIWQKGSIIRGEDPDIWRRDSAGNKIRFGSYGTKGKYGWEVDHRKPKAKGGSDSLPNLHPLHWRANRAKSDN